MGNVTNGNVGIYEPRSMSKSFDKNMPVTTFLRDMFFGAVNTFTTKKVDMDFRKGKYLTAPFVAPNVSGINVERTGYKTNEYEPPTIAISRPITEEMLNDRQMGETIHTTLSPEDRQQAIIDKDMLEMDNMITRREELMCSELLSNGIINVRGYLDDNLENYIDDNIDYGFGQKTTLETTEKWDESTSKKMDDIKSAVRQVRKAGYNPGAIILGTDAYDLLEADEDFRKLLDIRNFSIGELNPQLSFENGNGYTFAGILKGLNLPIYIYEAWYQTIGGTVSSIYPTDHFTVAPKNLGEMLYGAITQLEEDKRFHTYEGTRVPKIITNVSDDVLKHRLSSKPMPKPWDINSWATYKVV